MPAKWTIEKKQKHFNILHKLYVKENKTIGEIGRLLKTSEQTIYGRLKRVGIKPRPELKPGYLLKEREDIHLPQGYSPELAEFFGIMLGDGHLAPYQIVVTLGTKELAYVNYVADLIEKVFSVRPRVGVRKIIYRDSKYRDVYLGSKKAVRWLLKEGLVFNKVLAQVGVPDWIFNNTEFMKRFLRGFFDTDGSVYKLRWGCQVSFTNKSLPLLQSTYKMLKYLDYSPSRISGYKIYITKYKDLTRFFTEVAPQNSKHQVRFENFQVIKRAVT